MNVIQTNRTDQFNTEGILAKRNKNKNILKIIIFFFYNESLSI